MKALVERLSAQLSEQYIQYLERSWWTCDRAFRYARRPNGVVMPLH